MAEEIRVNRPSNPINRPDNRLNSDTHMVSATRSNSKLPWIILGIVVVALVVLGVLFRDRLFNAKDSDSASKAGKVGEYQAIFLTNGQVYFGKMTGANDRYVTLKDIYYLQVTQPGLQGPQTGQTGNSSTSATQQTTQQQPQLSLVKLGNELHGPVDEMKINRDHILFFEDMKEDGKVIQAIHEYQKNQGSGNPTSTTPANQTPAK